jgi:hypothetical protein
VNISNYLVLGKTSPLTYQVVRRTGVALSSAIPREGLHDSLFWLQEAAPRCIPHLISHSFLSVHSAQVLGHLKTVLILVLGFTVFNVSSALFLALWPLSSSQQRQDFAYNLPTTTVPSLYVYCRNRLTCATCWASPSP